MQALCAYREGGRAERASSVLLNLLTALSTSPLDLVSARVIPYTVLFILGERNRTPK